MINRQVARPVAKPNMLMKENPLFLPRFLKAILK
jgi:hypothetical protein